MAHVDAAEIAGDGKEGLRDRHRGVFVLRPNGPETTVLVSLLLLAPCSMADRRTVLRNIIALRESGDRARAYIDLIGMA
jgi:hypothetical protein